ncbi:hypothetical protein [Streptococcus macacae]|uniref:Peptidase, M50 family n=1 Tax=Streptococcus macacae NCTC 11558 TaxID=764298 RepID=G5JW18_9STRE|nr:hypothetical protein [Streptococcus macacae]EHJ52455.1 hypothetical protein STRMA_1431 [Streptococcus macacae NCTC 11558]SUN79351.1 Zn-dependent proteases [Streptococcus macacae NCTC 11558]
MPQTIEEYQNIQYSIHNHKRWLYNIRNDRMIVSEHPLENYLGDIDQPTSPLHDFYISPYKRGKMTNFHLIRIILDSLKIKSFYKVSLFLNKGYLTLIMLILSIAALPRITSVLPNSLSRFSMDQFSALEVFLIYMTTTLVILPLHEYAHFSVYYKYFKPPKVTFGFSLRYFSMPVFFIKVPFYRLLEGKEKNELILAGVKFQVAIWFFLTLIATVYPSTFVVGLLIVNLGLIITNLLPFLKLDGYWYLSHLLKVDDYMAYFKGMLSRQNKFRLDIFVLGVINNILILLSIISFAYSIISVFI